MSTLADTPNAYDELIRAATSLVGTELFDANLVEDLSDNELQVFLDANHAQLAAAREALRKGCFIPLRFEAAFWDEHCDDASRLRSLVRCFSAEATVATRNQKLTAAVDVWLDVLELSNAVRRNGLIVDQLLANAISRIGVEGLRKLRHQLNGEHALFLANELRRIDHEREPFRDIAERDSRWESECGSEEEAPSHVELDFGDEIDAELAEAFNQITNEFAALPREEFLQLPQSLDDESLSLLRLLCLEFALKAFFQRHDNFPKQLDQLCPNIIPSLPHNPFHGESFICRIADGQPILYATGPANKDHGGRFDSWHAVRTNRSDICLDMDDYAFGHPPASQEDERESILARVRQSSDWLRQRQ